MAEKPSVWTYQTARRQHHEHLFDDDDPAQKLVETEAGSVGLDSWCISV